MADNDSTSIIKKRLIVSALCKHLSLDYNKFSGDAVDNDLKSLYKILISSADGSPTQNDQMMKWIAFAEDFPTDYEAAFEALNALNEDLIEISVLLGNGLKPSAADVIVFSAIYSFVTSLSDSDRKKLLHVMRWMDYIQNKGNIGVMFEKILVEKRVYEPQLQGQGVKPIGKVEPESDAKKTVLSGKSADKQVELSTKKSDTMKKATEIKAPTQEKKKASETTTVDKEKEVSVSLLNIQVGLIRKAWKHPSADSLLVEEIDTGDAKLRQVVSGLAKYCNPEDLTNRHVVLITNVKPGKLRDVMSEGLVLCASSEDHTVVEPLRPPEGAKAGEQISFNGIDGKPEDVLNPKKKQLDKITPHLYTDEKGVATYKGIPFMTSAGPCTSSIPKASIK